MLSIDASANLRDVNWITRRMVKRNALAEPGLAAATFYVMLRALRLQAERAGLQARWHHEVTGALRR